MKKTTLVLTVLLSLALALPAAASQGKSKGKSKKGATSARSGSGTSVSGAVSITFGKGDIRLIRDWFGNPANVRGLPPGLAKRDRLPPGLQRHLERNGTLPPGLQKKIQPLPGSLRRRLPRVPNGVDIVFVAGNVLLLEVRTSKILDIVADIRIAF